MASANQLRSQLEYAKKQKAFAWAKYYQTITEEVGRAEIIVRCVNDFPQHIANELVELATELHKKFDCPICLEMVSKETIAITWCGHIYDKTCLETLKAQPDATCGICRKKL
jgi:hypothetical protein